ncbi:SAM-dependent methyltransferase [Streptomyces sp. JJ36]|uniref:SAM-dependent methyltransferase n=1 Tax=Streptomyces sp. JJ36 TaxID=2736645 RepID=UPI001F2F4B47|nr:SAM-dependent methyltransferase [Streptomyces sp. JJ36]MCF6522410.1 SAM-dependent methyltransferase [Streptomyces sp. JJ36]
MPGEENQAVTIDTSRPHSARMYDYYLGGKTHYEADAEAAERVLAVWPGVRAWARANRAFMHRSTRWLAGEAGVRQFLDIGTGIPTEPNLHQIAQQAVPDARVVYVDNDPIVLNYAGALMNGTPQGRTAYLHGDVTDPESILNAPELHATLDLTEPVALSLNALLHFVPDEQDPYGLVSRLTEALAPGSYLALSHGAPERDPEVRDAVTRLYRSSGIFVVGRTRAEVARFFDGLELVEPGVVRADLWRQPGDAEAPGVSLAAGVARKP